MAWRTGDALYSDTFMLSCRVRGRPIETAMLAQLASAAAARELRELRGCIVPTLKNEPVRDIFSRHGFTPCGETPAGGSLWVLPLSDQQLREPEWIAVENLDDERH